MVSSSSSFGLYVSDFEFGFTWMFRCMSDIYLWFTQNNILFSIQCVLKRKKCLTRIQDPVQNVPNRLDNADAVVAVVCHEHIQQDGLVVVVRLIWFHAVYVDVNVDAHGSLCTRLEPPENIFMTISFSSKDNDYTKKCNKEKVIQTVCKWLIWWWWWWYFVSW